jgi:hypothetical protein
MSSEKLNMKVLKLTRKCKNFIHSNLIKVIKKRCKGSSKKHSKRFERVLNLF